MGTAITALLIFGGLSAASLGCLFLHGRLPEQYRQDDTQNVVRLVANIFVVMTSLVLGLMLNTAKSRLDGINRDVHAFATDLILLDRTLRLHGPAAGDARLRLAAYVERASNARWTSGDSLLVSDRVSERLLDEVGSGIRAMAPTSDQHLAAWSDAKQDYRKIVELRWSLVEQSEGSLPAPLLGVLVGWLVLIFGSFGYRAPRNMVVVTSFVLAAGLISGSLYLILEMDTPFVGPISVSAAPLQRALAEMHR